MRLLSFCLLWITALPFLAAAAEIPANVRQELASKQEVAIIVKLKGQADFSTLGIMPLQERRRTMVRRLKDVATAARSRLLSEVPLKKSAQVKSLWHINSLVMTVDSDELTALAAAPDVDEIRLDAVIYRSPTTLAIPSSIQWNIRATGAPSLWALGYDGTGVVVASLDTGVDYLHVDLNSRWRGGSNSWFNPYASLCGTPGVTCGSCDENALTPCDYLDPAGIAHGTGVMSLMVGGAATGTSIGVAPGAQWIAAKIFKDDDTALYSAIHEAFAWLLDPDGNPATDDMPDVVNNSWGTDSVNRCDTEFLPDIQDLRDAGISVVFSAGNDGPNTATSVSPANNGVGLAVGAVNSADTVADFSARGPSACSGDTTFPDLVAPGVDILVAGFTSDGQYPIALLDGVSGTSFSAPQVAGVLALLRQAFPAAGVSSLDNALLSSALDLGISGVDNAYGYGSVDALAAYQLLAISISNSLSSTDGSSVPFGIVVPGEEKTAVVTLANNGGASLSVSSVGAGLATPFFVDNDLCSGNSVASGASCTFTVGFAPTTAGAVTAELDIVTNAGTSIMNLSGTGNNPPLPAELISPTDGAVLTGTSVTFKWTPGTDPDGNTVQSEVVLDQVSTAAAGWFPPIGLSSFGGGLLLLTLLGMVLFRRRTRLVFAGAAVLLILCSCGGGGGGGGNDSNVKTYQADGLSSGAYQWKVVTTDSLGASTDSEVRTFTLQ